jgi:2-phospho-L-lactate guanylyltransferase
MGAIVVPFRGLGGKRRLVGLSQEEHNRLLLAMLGDVLAAATEVWRTVVVTADESAREVAEAAGADAVADPGGGQGAAVAAALGLLPGDATLIVNADLPCVLPFDLRSLIAWTPRGGLAVVPSADGRTNALSLPGPELFQPLYGPRSAERFLRAAQELGVEAVAPSIPNLADDVDTFEDMERLQLRAGPRTQAALRALEAA